MYLERNGYTWQSANIPYCLFITYTSFYLLEYDAISNEEQRGLNVKS